MPKVMIVEDDPKILRAVSIRMRSAGFEVAASQDATTAMTTALQENPDVAILDISLPGGNGFSVAKRLQANVKTAGIPMIFLTASRKPGIAEKVEEVGAFAFIEKPYDPTVLVDTVRECLSQSPPAK